MIEVTQSFGRMNPNLKESLETMQPKENSDQRKKRLRQEARAAKEARHVNEVRAEQKVPTAKPTKQVARKPNTRSSKPKRKPRRARKPVPAV